MALCPIDTFCGDHRWDHVPLDIVSHDPNQQSSDGTSSCHGSGSLSRLLAHPSQAGGICIKAGRGYTYPRRRKAPYAIQRPNELKTTCLLPKLRPHPEGQHCQSHV
ncbi:hypothetical protein LIA77_08702 [Sarocladium implicatum]|nr:hypothetical protein LIA77_08702 [Sarocladium implicatum]